MQKLNKLSENTFFEFEISGLESENQIKIDSVVKIKGSDIGYFINSLKVRSSNDEDINDEGEGSDEDMGEVDDVMVDDDFLERNSLEEEMSLIMHDHGDSAGSQGPNSQRQITTMKKIFTPMNKEEFNDTVI